MFSSRFVSKSFQNQILVFFLKFITQSFYGNKDSLFLECFVWLSYSTEVEFSICYWLNQIDKTQVLNTSNLGSLLTIKFINIANDIYKYIEIYMNKQYTSYIIWYYEFKLLFFEKWPHSLQSWNYQWFVYSSKNHPP